MLFFVQFSALLTTKGHCKECFVNEASTSRTLGPGSGVGVPDAKLLMGVSYISCLPKVSKKMKYVEHC